MENLQIHFEEILVFLETMPQRYRSYAENALLEQDPQKIAEIGMSLLGESPRAGLIIDLGTSHSKSRLWDKIVDEIYSLICTDEEKYKEERSKFTGTFQSLVSVISASVGSTVNVSVGIITGVVTIALIGVAKIGRNAWCAMRAPVHPLP